jgi:hypothetical protein
VRKVYRAKTLVELRETGPSCCASQKIVDVGIMCTLTFRQEPFSPPLSGVFGSS